MEVHAVNACDQGWQNADGADDGQDFHAVILFDADEAECGVQQELDLVDGLGIEVIEGCDVAPCDLDAGFQGLRVFFCPVADIDQDPVQPEQAVAGHGGEIAAMAEAAQGFAQHFARARRIPGTIGVEDPFGDGIEVAAKPFQDVCQTVDDFLDDLDKDFVGGGFAFGGIAFGLTATDDVEAIIVGVADGDEACVCQDEADRQGKRRVVRASDEGRGKIENAAVFVMARGAFDFLKFVAAGNMGAKGLFRAVDLFGGRVDEVEPDRFGNIDVRSDFPGRNASGAHEEHQADPWDK